MRTIKCDKCKKKISLFPSLDIDSRGDFLGEKVRSIELCEECAQKLGKVIRKFLKAK